MSKRIWHHPDVPADETTLAWRSTGQLEDTADFREWLEREFPRGAAEMADQDEAETSRRSFLKLMGASTALAGFGMAACRRPETHILPYVDAPEWVIPGKATYYASSFPRLGGATPLVVTSFEGRPTKLAPNTLHPDHSGTDAFAQATVLDLYSPSRSTAVRHQGSTSSRQAFEEALANVAKSPEAKVAFLFGRDDSPTRHRLRRQLGEKFARAKFYAYEALEGELPRAQPDGTRFVADFSKADRIVSLDCDFAELDPVGPKRPFFERRKPEGPAYDQQADENSLNRLYIAESQFSLTGGMADHRLRLRPSQLPHLAAYLAIQLGIDPGLTPVVDERIQRWVDPMVADLQAHRGRSLVVVNSRAPEFLHHLVAQINAQLDAIGEDKPLHCVTTGQADYGDLAALVAALDGGEIDHLFLFTPSNPVYDAPADLRFADALAKAGTSYHFGLRTDATAHAATWHIPASHFLESWGDSRSAHGVLTVVQPLILPLYPDCVSELEVLIALLDAEGKLTTGEGSAAEPTPALQAVKATFAELVDPAETAWKTYLRDGFSADSAYPTASFAADSGRLRELAAVVPPPETEALEIVFATDSSVYDGRWIDNGWLQEAPDPISKVSWDNVALIAPKTAKKLGLYDQIVALESSTAGKPADGEGQHRTGQMIRLRTNGADLEVPVQIGFGQAEDTIIVSLGYGQGFDEEDELGRGPLHADHVGQVGVNSGFNAYPLRTSRAAYSAPLEGPPVKLDQRYKIAAVQEHHAMYGRALAREVSTMPDQKKGDFEHQLASVKKHGMDSHVPPNISLYKPEDQQGKPLLSDPLHQWAMSIDLTSCTGCNACLVACQAENNIPIVGKQQLAMGREMHWIRMDRYFSVQPMKDADGDYLTENGKKVYDDDNMELIPQPVACVQCESAPCETVCPVNATVHTEDGLNSMAYNRCIGTRYCANNCPYKARRFNFFDYNKRNPLVPHNLYRGPLGEKQVGEAPHLQRNPNVSVRMRGVMEKCTYCVQRLKDAKIRQKRRQKEDSLRSGSSAQTPVGTPQLRIPVDSVKVACQEACPAEAISFGNLLDKDAKVVRAKGNELDSIKALLGEEEYAKIHSPGLERNYDLLNYIGTRPRTSYLARVKNPNPAMPGAAHIGKATIHMH